MEGHHFLNVLADGRVVRLGDEERGQHHEPIQNVLRLMDTGSGEGLSRTKTGALVSRGNVQEHPEWLAAEHRSKGAHSWTAETRRRPHR